MKVLEENHYYPFDLKHSYNYSKMSLILEAFNGAFVKKVVQVPNSGYQYRAEHKKIVQWTILANEPAGGLGKEWQDELGLNMYSMDMRQYDPAIARRVVQDSALRSLLTSE